MREPQDIDADTRAKLQALADKPLRRVGNEKLLAREALKAIEEVKQEKRNEPNRNS